MTTINKLRQEDYSILYFIKDLLPSEVTIVDAFPIEDLQSEKLVLPTVSVQHKQTTDAAVGELGSTWNSRLWNVDVFARSDVERDELAGRIYDGLANDLPIKDYSIGFPPDITNQSILEYASVSNRELIPSYSWNEYSVLKYWRMIVRFRTITTSVT